MELWHFTYYVDKNDPNSEIKTLKIESETGKEAVEIFEHYTTVVRWQNPFTTVFRCEGEVK